MSDPLETLRSRAARLFASQAFGCHRVERLEAMADGHAGHTFRLDLTDTSERTARYVLKMGPAGVPRRGSADIFRQAPLLEALCDQGLPVPAIRWACAEEEPLGAPFIVMERLPGRSLIIWDPAPRFLLPGVDLRALWLAGANALAAIHRVRHEPALAGWEPATPLFAELDRWSRLIRHSEDPASRALLDALASALRRTQPPEDPVGLVHGDFQPGNILYDEGRLAGVIDWDLAMIGAQGMDVGWYLMMADAGCWDPGWRPVTTAPRQELLRAYAEAGGPALGYARWHQAFAHFRFGAIAGLNLKLHRDGRRHDPMWEKLGLSVPALLRAGLRILDGRDAP